MARHFARFYPFGIKIVHPLSLLSLYFVWEGKGEEEERREEVGRGGQASETLSTGSREKEPPTVLATKEVRERVKVVSAYIAKSEAVCTG